MSVAPPILARSPQATTQADSRVELGDALDAAPFTHNHLKIWMLSAMGLALDGFDFFIIGVALPFIQQDFHPQPWQTGAIGAAAVLGATLGALVLGPVTDRLGRKAMYLVDLGFFVVFAVLSALAWDPWSLIVFRFLLGIGVGADYPISASFVAETMPSRLRGKLVSSTIGFQALGMVGGALVGLLILWLYPETGAWRWMLAVGALPALVIMALRMNVPESPRWLLAHGRTAEAVHAAAQLVSPEDLDRIDLKVHNVEERPGRIGELFSPRLLRRTLLVTLPWFFMDVATYGVGVFTPTILAALAFEGDGSFLSRQVISLEGAAVLDLFLLVGFALGILLIDRVGRIRLQLLGFSAMALGLGVLMLATRTPGAHEMALVFAGFVLFNTFMNLGPNTTTYVLPAEVFPTRLRATGHGIAAATGKIGAALGIFLLPVLQSAIGLGPTLAVVAGAALIGLLTTWLFRVETSGRSLQEFE